MDNVFNSFSYAIQIVSPFVSENDDANNEKKFQKQYPEISEELKTLKDLNSGFIKIFNKIIKIQGGLKDITKRKVLNTFRNHLKILSIQLIRFLRRLRN